MIEDWVFWICVIFSGYIGIILGMLIYAWIQKHEMQVDVAKDNVEKHLRK